MKQKLIVIFIFLSCVHLQEVIACNSIQTNSTTVKYSKISQNNPNSNIIRRFRIWVKNRFRNPCNLNQPKRITIRPKYGGDSPRSKTSWGGNCQ